MTSSKSSNRLVVPGAKKGMETFRNEVASELGIQIPQDGDMGNLTSRQNGSIGGYMVKKMIASVEDQIKNGQMPSISSSSRSSSSY